MSGITIGPDGNHMAREKGSGYLADFDALCEEWKQVDGKPMPEHIRLLPLDGIRNALRYLRSKWQPVTETGGNDDSLKSWDDHKEF